MTEKAYRVVEDYRERYKECIRMLNGLERTLEKKLPTQDRRWHIAEDGASYGEASERCPAGSPAET